MRDRVFERVKEHKIEEKTHHFGRVVEQGDPEIVGVIGDVSRDHWVPVELLRWRHALLTPVEAIALINQLLLARLTA